MEIGDNLKKHFRTIATQEKALKKLGIETIGDLLYHFPARYEDLGQYRPISEVDNGEKVVIYGKLSDLKIRKAWKRKIPMAEGYVTDNSGKIKVLWFHQPYIAKMYPEGTLVRLEGKVGERSGTLSLSNPATERATALPTGLFESKNLDSSLSFPVYRESRGVTSRWMYHAVQKVFASGILDTLEDTLPEKIRKKYSLPALKSALVWMHTPQNPRDSLAARKRFAFEEVFFIQLAKQRDRARYDNEPSWEIVPTESHMKKFTDRFPFKPTKAQTRAVNEILKDMSTPSAMSRLLEGDVGSGKTYVAATSAYAVATTHPRKPHGSEVGRPFSKKNGLAKNMKGGVQDFGNLQVAYMAPTEILAKQHFESFIEFFSEKGAMPIQIGLITSSGCRKFPSKVDSDTWTDISRTQLLKWVKNGEIPILIGTHSLIQKSVEFKHLAYVIIDEQHRFGTNQRAALAQKDKDAQMPHLLSMTATPIPRTLALTIFGDLDLTLLDEMPPGRKEIISEIVKPDKQMEVYEKIRKELEAGRQAYVICPRIEEPDPEKATALRVKSVEKESKRLRKEIYPEFSVDMLHGKLRPKEKDKVMDKFTKGRTNILVATSVIEVGVNVANATVIIIEGAERFGLAQLHQLRGRVLRSTHQAYCYIFPSTKSSQSLKRLRALEKAKNGFELAEQDLELRGTGELTGGRQWGISDIGMEAIRNIKMVEAARKEAHEIIAKDPELDKHYILKTRTDHYENIHFE